MRRFVTSAALVVASLAGTLLLLEGAIRLYSALWFPRMMQLDAELGWKHTPNTRKFFTNETGESVETRQNEYGHRGRAYRPGRESQKKRVLVLGDSFTEGNQVGEEDLVTAVLERINPNLEVINAGVGGYGTVQQYLYLESAGLKHRPDLVLLMVFENDLTDNCSPAYPGFGPRPYAVLKGEGVQILSDPDGVEFLKYALPVPLANTLNRNSYLFYFLNTSIYQRLRASKMRELQKADLKRAEHCGTVEVMARLIDRMQTLVAQHRARLAVVFIPTREHARKGDSPVLKPVIDHCARSGIAHLSLADRLHASMDTLQPYFVNDIHWTKAGHRLAAEEISLLVNRVQRDDADRGRP